jgi:DNA-binding winged helix-turn-helix (wHTH) protein/tetratricopeptide (TPR) repeat protein
LNFVYNWRGGSRRGRRLAEAVRVVLAHEPEFILGRLEVSPAMRELVRDDGQREVLEHRVMEVLVALARSAGKIVTRDELTERCWQGRVVGVDAINRVISRLRRAADGIGTGSFRIETITKVGYRLNADVMPSVPGFVTDRHTAQERHAPLSASRRGFVVAAAAAGAVLAAGGGAFLYRRVTRPVLPPEVPALLARAAQARDFTVESQNEAIGLYRRVTEIAPNYADGWALLAVAYATPSHYRERSEAEMLRRRSASAAQRAFDLESANGFAELAVATALPFIGHWTERDRRLRRALSDRANEPDILAAAAVLAQSTGRFSDAVKFFERIRPRPLRPAVHNNYTRSLWSAGRMEEADRALEEGLSLYPNYGGLWFTRFDMLLTDGRASAAIAMAQDVGGLPTGLSQPEVDRLTSVARAMDSSDSTAAEAVMVPQIRRAHQATGPAEDAIRTAGMLGLVDHAFAIADAYYFRRGFTVPDVRFTREDGFYSPPEQRQIHFLFEPLTRSMRADRRFARLTEELGLEGYWRESRVQPAFRKG